MAILLLVLFWVLVGLAVFAVAMRSGPRRVRDAAAAWRGERRSLFAVSLLTFVVFGIGLPAVVLATHTGNRTKEGPSGVDLTASEAHGRQLFIRNCGVCHTLGAVHAVGKVGPNLDILRPPAGLVRDAVQHGRARGHGQMPANLLQGDDLRSVAAFVAKVAGR